MVSGEKQQQVRSPFLQCAVAPKIIEAAYYLNYTILTIAGAKNDGDKDYASNVEAQIDIQCGCVRSASVHCDSALLGMGTRGTSADRIGGRAVSDPRSQGADRSTAARRFKEH
jgi:hypothetical protein